MKLSISARILGGFVVMAVLLLTITANSFFTSKNTDSSFQKVSNTTLPSIQSIYSIEMQLSKMSKDAVKLLHASSISELEEVKMTYEKDDKKFKDYNTDFHNVISNNNEMTAALNKTTGVVTQLESKIEELIQFRQRILNAKIQLIDIYEKNRGFDR